MDWSLYIHSDPEILLGKPVLKGTRLSVDFILRLFARGWTEQQVLENYPTITLEALWAVFAYAAEVIQADANRRAAQSQAADVWAIAGIAYDPGPLIQGVAVSERPELYLANFK